MNILEKDIETLIYEAATTNLKLLHSRGLALHENIVRQLNLGPYGIADLVCFDYDPNYIHGKRRLDIQVVELKKDVVDVNTLMQSCRYESGIRNIIGNHFNLKRTYISFNHLLIGKTIQENGDFVYLSDSMPNVSLFTYQLDFVKGLTFINHSGYYHTGPTKNAFEGLKHELLKATKRIREEQWQKTLQHSGTGTTGIVEPSPSAGT